MEPKRSEGQLILDLLADRPVAYHPMLARRLGSVNAAVMLGQLLYWTGRQHCPDGWIYKTHHDWTAETALSRYEQATARKVMREHGILEEERRAGNRLHFRVDLEAIKALMGLSPNQLRKTTQPDAQNLTTGCEEKRNSLTETTPETTTEYTECAAEKTPQPERQKPTAADRKAVYGALARITGWDPDLKRGRLNKSVQRLGRATHPLEERAYSADDLALAARYWYREDWRGKKRHRPTAEQIEEVIRAAVLHHAHARDGPIDLEKYTTGEYADLFGPEGA